MNPDREEPLLDACLEEVLGHCTPPDLTERIMQALAACHRDGELMGQRDAVTAVPEPPPILTSLDQALVQTGSQAVVALRDTTPICTHQRVRLVRRAIVAVAFGAVGLAVAIGLSVIVNFQRSPLADAGARPDKNLPATSSPRADAAVAREAGFSEQLPSIPLAEELPSAPAPAVESRGAVQLAGTSPATDLVPGLSSAPTPLPPPERRYGPRSPDADVVSFVNLRIAKGWNDSGVKPAPPAGDAEWCQRVFVRVLGRVPSPDELKIFSDDKSSTRREKLVERLLSGSEYSEDYAKNWAAIWTTALIGRSGGQAGSLASRQELEKYLQSALLADKPLDQIVEALLTATGSAKPEAEDFNPAVNFLLDGIDANLTVPTARVARVLLGHQLQCAQCHAHPTQGWTQEQFWALNSFFRQMRVDRRGESPRLVNADFYGEGRAANGEVFYETSGGLMKTAFPRFLDGTEIPTSGVLATVDRRRELARLIVRSDDLPRALTNRVWAHFFDYGFTRPIDDLGPNTPPAQAQLVDRLATEFAARGFDLKSLIRWTVLSDPFNRSSKITDLVSKDMPEEGEPALFSRYYSRPPQAADLYRSLVQAAKIRRTSGTDGERDKARIDWLAQFNRGVTKAGGKAGGGKIASANEPSLMIKTGDLAGRSASGDPTGLVKKLAASSLPFEKKVEHLFLAAAARQPTPRERQAAAELLKLGGDNPDTALDDLWWALLNSSECALDR